MTDNTLDAYNAVKDKNCLSFYVSDEGEFFVYSHLEAGTIVDGMVAAMNQHPDFAGIVADACAQYWDE